MRLVVIGGYSLDVLQEQVVKTFSAVPSNGSNLSWDTPRELTFKSAGMPFTESCLGKIFYIAPVKDRHSINITWQIPPQRDEWKSKPEDYLAHLIGHEAEGSLLAALKAKGWATSCCAGVGDEGFEVSSMTLLSWRISPLGIVLTPLSLTFAQDASSHCLFIVSFTLLEEGIRHWKELVSMLYQYVGMLRYHCRNGLPAWIYEELRSINEISYRFVDEMSPIDHVEGLADELNPSNPVPAERLLDWSSLLFEYEPGKIQVRNTSPYDDCSRNCFHLNLPIRASDFGRHIFQAKECSN